MSIVIYNFSDHPENAEWYFTPCFSQIFYDSFVNFIILVSA